MSDTRSTGFRLCIIAVSATSWLATAQATEVFRWVDENGVVHFSDSAPEHVEAESLVLNDSTPPDYDPLEDPYSILNQAERLRDARVRLEEERESRQAETAARRDTGPPPAYDDPYYASYYRPYLPSILSPVAPRPGQQRRILSGQIRALEETGLQGRRPASINSGEHRARVNQSRALPLAGGPARQP